jgi:hypothetical protein
VTRPVSGVWCLVCGVRCAVCGVQCSLSAFGQGVKGDSGRFGYDGTGWDRRYWMRQPLDSVGCRWSALVDSEGLV